MTTHQRLYVELDALLDTRIATVSVVDQDVAADILDGGYRERFYDLFSTLSKGFNDSEYERQYAKRDVNTLMRSRPTPMVFTIAGLTKTLSLQMHQGSPLVQGLTVFVNLHPYILDEEEKVIIHGILAGYWGVECDIVFEFHDIGEMTTAMIKASQYTSLFIYNFKYWMETVFADETVPVVNIPDISLYAPALLISPELHDEGIKLAETLHEAVDPHEALRMLFAGVIGLGFMPVAQFSII